LLVELRRIARAGDDLVVLGGAIRDGFKTIAQATGASGGDGSLVAAAQGPVTPPEAPEAARSAINAETEDKQRANFRSNVTSLGAEFVASAANPLTPTAAAGLSTAENLLALVAGAVAGDKGAEAAQALARGAFNAGGGAETRFVLDNTTRDLQGTLSALADQGIIPSDKQIEELAGAFQGRAQRRFDLLKRGADAVDAVTGGQLKDAADKTAAEALSVLKAIEKNTAPKSNQPATASLRGGGEN
jgi:hypothetical protein